MTLGDEKLKGSMVGSLTFCFPKLRQVFHHTAHSRWLILMRLPHRVDHENFKRLFRRLQLQTQFLNGRENRNAGRIDRRWRRTDFTSIGTRETWGRSSETRRSPVQPEIEQPVQTGFIKDGA